MDPVASPAGAARSAYEPDSSLAAFGHPPMMPVGLCGSIDGLSIRPMCRSVAGTSGDRRHQRKPPGPSAQLLQTLQSTEYLGSDPQTVLCRHRRGHVDVEHIVPLGLELPDGGDVVSAE